MNFYEGVWAESGPCTDCCGGFDPFEAEAHDLKKVAGLWPRAVCQPIFDTPSASNAAHPPPCRAALLLNFETMMASQSTLNASCALFPLKNCRFLRFLASKRPGFHPNWHLRCAESTPFNFCGSWVPFLSHQQAPMAPVSTSKCCPSPYFRVSAMISTPPPKS